MSLPTKSPSVPKNLPESITIGKIDSDRHLHTKYQNITNKVLR